MIPPDAVARANGSRICEPLTSLRGDFLDILRYADSRGIST
jgi:hypothetical protein